jgi:spermidine synthase
VEGGAWRALIHGDIVHGIEATDPAHWTETTTYYNATGPAGQFFARLPEVRRVAAIGLGTGGLVCYRKPGQQWTFFEIDSAVIRIAHDVRYFHYLQQCGADTGFVLGDGRLSLDGVADGSFDVMVLDAFSSDAIPVHLLTREAMQLYFRKLAPHGRLLVHISNRYLELAPVVAADAASIGAVALRQNYKPTEAETARWATPSEWVAVARDAADLDFLRDDPLWQALVVPPGFRPWTDDFSNVLGVMQW